MQLFIDCSIIRNESGMIVQLVQFLSLVKFVQDHGVLIEQHIAGVNKVPRKHWEISVVHEVWSTLTELLRLFTFPPVDFGEDRAVAAGQLGGASERRWRQIGHQRVVAHFCQPIEKKEIHFKPLWPLNLPNKKENPNVCELQITSWCSFHPPPSQPTITILRCILNPHAVQSEPCLLQQCSSLTCIGANKMRDVRKCCSHEKGELLMGKLPRGYRDMKAAHRPKRRVTQKRNMKTTVGFSGRGKSAETLFPPLTLWYLEMSGITTALLRWANGPLVTGDGEEPRMAATVRKEAHLEVMDDTDGWTLFMLQQSSNRAHLMSK